MKRMLIVDGNSILNRAFYGVRPLSTHDGIPTNAVYGMMTILSRHLEQICPDYAVCAFDLKAPTFRHKTYDAYKANRKGMPEELATQLPYAKDAVRALGMTVLTLEGYEADDILGTLSRCANEREIEALVLTGDRDSLQLISDKTTVLLAGNQETKPFTTEVFYEHYGVLPTQFVDVKAIMGDSSDNIPGVAGIGEKGALALISRFSSLDGVYENLESPEIKPAMKQKLIAGKENAYLSQFLAKIECHAPIELAFDEWEYHGTKLDLLRPLCTKLELFSLQKRLEEKASQTQESAVCATPDAPCAIEVTADTSDSVLPIGRLSLLQKENDLYLSNGDTVWLLKNTAPESLSLFFDNSRNFCVTDAKSYYKRASESGKSRPCIGFDALLAAYVLHAKESDYDLEGVASAWLHQNAGEDGASQARALYLLWDVLDKELTETNTAKLYYEVELPLCHVLADMEGRGFLVDCDGLTAFSQELQTQMEALTARIYEAAGHAFNLNSPKQLGEVLFSELGLPSAKKTKTGYSTNAEILEKLRPYHPIVADILDYRQVMKLQSTYALGLLKVADAQGRVHTTFHQMKTMTGRLSSSEPNLQNIPIRTELGRRLRRYFVAKEDYLLVDADYSQIELRILAGIADDQAMRQAFLDGVDIHTLTASQVFHVPMEEVTFEQRKMAKAVNFGIVYGISKFSLAEDLHISRWEAGEYIDRYFETYPGVQAYMQEIVEQAKSVGYVPTLWGRRRYIPELSSSKAPLRAFGERVARNSPIQGTAADLMKVAMVAVDCALQEANLDAHLILQVHDELIVESHKDCAKEAAEILRREMEAISICDLPLLAEANIAENLLDSKG